MGVLWVIFRFLYEKPVYVCIIDDKKLLSIVIVKNGIRERNHQKRENISRVDCPFDLLLLLCDFKPKEGQIFLGPDLYHYAN